MIGFNNTFGWSVRNNTGLLSPADRASLVQWLDNYNDDGTWSDKIDPRLDSPESVDVGVLAFDGTQVTIHNTNAGVTD